MRVNTLVSTVAAAAVGLGNVATAIVVNFDQPASVKAAAASIVFDMMSYYTGNMSGEWNVPGLLPQPPSGYYWWEAGAMWGTMIDYWHVTGDASYNDVVTQALQFQVGPNADFMPPNQTKTLGNDDQGFWGLAAMTAAEFRFPDPPKDKPQWLALAQAVFNTQAPRWDLTSCNGGLKWQIFPFNNGYDYKNTISNGCFFNLGSRLAKYTDNDTYAQWAEKTWDWTTRVGLIDKDYNIYDGSDDKLNCTQVNGVQYSYNAGVWLLGAANMYNYTGGSEIWKTRVNGILSRTLSFFTDPTTGVLMEVACETQVPPSCNTDMKSFKAYLTRWMAATTKMAPFTYDIIEKALLVSAKAAAAQCTGGDKGRACGLKWVTNGKTGTWDGTTGVGEQMGALEVIQSTLVAQTAGPVTNKTGGTSAGNPSAGSGSARTAADLRDSWVPTTGDRAGAGILTAIVLVGVLGGVGWVSMD